MVSRSVAFFVAVLMLRGIGVPGVSTEQRQIGGVGITVFEDREFRGRSATFREDVPDLRKFNLNDRITSLRIARGETWEICIDVDYGGRCQVFSASEPDLHDRGGWNDEISSLRRIRGGVRPPVGQPQIVLYDRTGFRGSSRRSCRSANPRT